MGWAARANQRRREALLAERVKEQEERKRTRVKPPKRVVLIGEKNPFEPPTHGYVKKPKL